MELTQLLLKVRDGDKEAYNQLYPLIYDKLKQIAQHQINRDNNLNTLSKTELVHEVYVKMVDQKHIDYQNRAHFFSIAARSMRQILVDYARKKLSQKAGGNFSRINMDTENLQSSDDPERILALNEMLIKLKELNERLCTVVELRFFVGLNISETAEILNISTATANRDWLKARVWLYRQLSNPES